MRTPWLAVSFVALAALTLGTPDASSQLAQPGPEGRLIYRADERGNAIPDFSRAGYGGGGVALPDIPVARTLAPHATGDDGKRIQAALDEVGALTPDARGFRGAVLLKRGVYRVEGQLRVGASGVILRGEGQDPMTP